MQQTALVRRGQENTRVITATRPLLRVSRPYEGSYVWIRKGREGSLQTAVEMAKLVRRDTVSDEGLENFAVQKMLDARLDSHSRAEDVIETLFRYVQSIPYVYDPAGSFDSINSARHTLAKGRGDCDDLAVLLATLLALVGYKPRFVLAKYRQATEGFDHVYVDVVIQDKSGTRRIALDPCSRSHGMGWESRNAIELLTFPIFAGKVSAIGAIGPLVATGAQVGLSFIPVVGPILSSLVGPLAGMFSRTQQRSEETARDTWKAEVHDGMLKIQQAIDSCKITPDQGKSAARELVNNYYAACDANFTKSSVAKSCRNAENEPGGFTERINRMAASGKSCAAGSDGAAASAFGLSSTGVAGISWPVILIVAGGAYFLLKR